MKVRQINYLWIKIWKDKKVNYESGSRIRIRNFCNVKPKKIDIKSSHALGLSKMSLTFKADFRTTMSPAGWIHGSPSTWHARTIVGCHWIKVMNHLNGDVAIHMNFDMTSLDNANGGSETTLYLAQVDDT